MTGKLSLCAVICAVQLAGAASALAEVVTLPPMQDTTLYQENPESRSNGAGVYTFSGRTLNGDLRRALVAFDVAAAIPAGAVINSASLTLHLSRTSRAGPESVALHRLLRAWGEGASDATAQEGTGAPATPQDATWAFSLVATQTRWTTPGGDYAATASAAVTVGVIGTYTWPSTPELVADVQSWVDEPAGNFGWIVLSDESGGPSAKRFDSRENTSAAFRPALTLDYTLAPIEPIVVSIAEAAGMLALNWNPGRPGLLYTVQTRASLTAGDWTPAAGGAWPIAETSWMDPMAATAAVRFYRVLASQP